MSAQIGLNRRRRASLSLYFLPPVFSRAIQIREPEKYPPPSAAMEKPAPPISTTILHAKLLASDLLSSHHRFSRAETLGVITSRDLKPDRFLRFTVDDGTGCIPCILWLNQLSSSYFASRSNVQLASEIARSMAELVKIGAVARVRGRITRYRGAVQITVSDVAIERDPNAEVLHWLDCIRLERTVYGLSHS